MADQAIASNPAREGYTGSLRHLRQHQTSGASMMGHGPTPRRRPMPRTKEGGRGYALSGTDAVPISGQSCGGIFRSSLDILLYKPLTRKTHQFTENYMSRPKRSISDIVHFRDDISPFLIHMTRKTNKKTAKENLQSILSKKEIVPGKNPVSAAQYARSMSRNSSNWLFMYNFDELDKDIQDCFRAVCFSETPIRFSHCLFDISGRGINLEPYGLVLIKDRLQKKGVSPVMYINNYPGDKDSVIDQMADLVYLNRTVAQEILPLIGVTGRYLHGGAMTHHDFQWEREWRYPAFKGNYQIEEEDLFIGLCPISEIDEFERKFPGILFIDPLMPPEYFATKLIESRKKNSIQHSVV